VAQTEAWGPVDTQQGQPWRLRPHFSGGLLALKHRRKPKRPAGGIIDDWGFANYLKPSQQNVSAYMAAWRARGWMQNFGSPTVPLWLWVPIDRSDWTNFATTYLYQDPKGRRYKINALKWFLLANRAWASAYGGFAWRTVNPGLATPWANCQKPTVPPDSLAITSVTLAPDGYGGTVATVLPPQQRLNSYTGLWYYLSVGITMCLPGFPKGRDRDVPNYWLNSGLGPESVPPGTPDAPRYVAEPGPTTPWGSKFPGPLRMGFRYCDYVDYPPAPGGSTGGTPGPLFIINGQIF
jgi:hypothetical protein